MGTTTTEGFLWEGVLSAVDRQLSENEPPETRQTMDRLLGAGFSRHQAREMIAQALLDEIYAFEEEGRPFNHARFTRLLNQLP